MSETNPFTLAYQALWTCLESRSDFTTLVASANRIKFSGTKRDPWARLADCKSFPAVAIVPVAANMSKLDCDSHTSDVEKAFGIYVAAGNQQLDDLFDVEFAILRAMTDWRTAIGAVQWNSRNCVLDASLYEHPEELDNKLISRGIRGWSCVWAGRVWFTFVTTELTAEDSSSSGAD